MITVHYLDNSRAHRILWLLEELGLDYAVKTYRRGANLRAPEELKAIHPLGKSPVVTDGELVLAESGAIAEYLVETYGGNALIPAPGTPERLAYRYWLHYAEGSAMPLLQTKLTFDVVARTAPIFVRPIAKLIAGGVNRSLIAPQVKDHVAMWEKALAANDWFAGAGFTAADILMSFPVEAGASRVDYGDDIPAIRTWLAAIRARPAYRRALEKGGAYAYSASAA